MLSFKMIALAHFLRDRRFQFQRPELRAWTLHEFDLQFLPQLFRYFYIWQ